MFRKLPRIGCRWFTPFNKTALEEIDAAISVGDTAKSLNLFLHNASFKPRYLPVQQLDSLYELCRRSDDPLCAYTFAQLVPSSRDKQFDAVVNKAMSLFILHDDLESAMLFLRNVQVANAGTISIEYKTLESLLLACQWQNELEFAWETVKTMLQVNGVVFSRDWAIFLSLVLQHRHVEALEWFFRTAAIPDYVIIDDYGLINMAAVAANSGQFHICRWAVLRLRRRHRYLGIENPKLTLRLFIYLVEASCSNEVKKRETGGSIKSACRYLVNLSNGAADVKVVQLKQFFVALEKPDVLEYVLGIFEELIADDGANRHVKTLLFNILLKFYLSKDDLNNASLVFDCARGNGIEFNDDSFNLLVQLGEKQWDVDFIETVVQLAGRNLSEKTAKSIEEAKNRLS